METKAEYQIWDTIVNSAKTKFDYKHIRAMFKKEDEEITDKFLFHIIAGFACGENHQTISTNLFNELQSIHFECNEEQIDRFIADKHVKFSPEIYATYLAFSMLEDGEDVDNITEIINNLLQLDK
jgi:hypothetical protein